MYPSEVGQQRDIAENRNVAYVSLILLAVLSASLIVNVILGWKIGYLTHTTHEPIDKLGIGSKITDLQLIKLDGTAAPLILEGERQTLIYVFRPGCSWCSANLSAIRGLAAGLRDVRVVGLSTTSIGLKSYLATSPLPFPVYTPKDVAALQSLHVIGTPQTVLISSGGTILGEWPGLYNAFTASSIGSALHMHVAPAQVSEPK